MICSSCKRESAHIKSYLVAGSMIELCNFCGEFSEAGGSRTDGILSRNRFSVRRDSSKHEGDMLPPHVYDKHSRQVIPREEFVRKYPEKVGDYFTQGELDKQGHKKLKAVKSYDPKKKNIDVEHHGDVNKRLKEVL